MADPAQIVRDFLSLLGDGDSTSALGLLDDDFSMGNLIFASLKGGLRALRR